MKLSDIMGHMNLAHYAEIGLILFLIAFVAIAVRLFLFTSKGEMQSAALIPFAAEPGDAEASSDQESSHV